MLCSWWGDHDNLRRAMGWQYRNGVRASLFYSARLRNSAQIRRVAYQRSKFGARGEDGVSDCLLGLWIGAGLTVSLCGLFGLFRFQVNGAKMGQRKDHV
jgi:hypothetical protein